MLYYPNTGSNPGYGHHLLVQCASTTSHESQTTYNKGEGR